MEDSMVYLVCQPSAVISWGSLLRTQKGTPSKQQHPARTPQVDHAKHKKTRGPLFNSTERLPSPGNDSVVEGGDTKPLVRVYAQLSHHATNAWQQGQKEPGVLVQLSWNFPASIMCNAWLKARKVGARA